ncbi:MAG: nitroreductase family deazaflavin-dependent oxidoreductase [Proteobacteria bacterium]|nr:nitroreductase family deazaflavin-dependent oxidoreductase [Pseudomonadota bacterium]
MADFSQIDWIAKHIALYKSDPEKAHMWDAGPAGGKGVLPTLLLTTTGRKTGKPRALPLIYGNVSESYAIIASKGGMPNHPIWFRNLEANPNCDLMVGAKAVTARARIVTGEERETVWKMMAEVYPPYLEYQERTEREIPVIVLDPIED